MTFVAVRQFASAVGTKEVKSQRVRLPAGAETAPDGTTVYPATVWTKGELLQLPGYFASTSGEVWSRRQQKQMTVLSVSDNLVSLKIDTLGKQRTFLVHRIVASTFLSCIKLDAQTEVDHVDRNRNKNDLENLRWATKKQNASNKCPVKKKATAARLRYLFSRAVQQLCPQNGSVLAEFPSSTIAMTALGIKSKNAIGNCMAGRSPTAGGFAWRLAPRQMTLESFKNRGFEVVGGIEEAPHFYFSEDLQVYNDNTGTMYQILATSSEKYPTIRIDGSGRLVHSVVQALRLGHASLRAFDRHLASTLHVVMHDEDKDKNDWWNCKTGTRSDNGLDAARNGCNKGRTAARPISIHLVRDATSAAWKHDGRQDAVFSSTAEAARALAGKSPLKDLQASIYASLKQGISFSVLVEGTKAKAWAFKN